MFVLFFPPSFFSYQLLIVGKFNLWTDQVRCQVEIEFHGFQVIKDLVSLMIDSQKLRWKMLGRHSVLASGPNLIGSTMLELTHRFRVEIISIGNSMEVIEHVLFLCFFPPMAFNLCFPPQKKTANRHGKNHHITKVMHHVVSWMQLVQLQEVLEVVTGAQVPIWRWGMAGFGWFRVEGGGGFLKMNVGLINGTIYG